MESVFVTSGIDDPGSCLCVHEIEIAVHLPAKRKVRTITCNGIGIVCLGQLNYSVSF